MNEQMRRAALITGALVTTVLIGAGPAIERKIDPNVAPVTVIAGNCPWSVTLAQSVVELDVEEVGISYTHETPVEWQAYFCPAIAARLREQSPMFWLRRERWLCEAVANVTDAYHREHFAWFPAFIVDGVARGPGEGEEALSERGYAVVRDDQSLRLLPADAVPEEPASQEAAASASERTVNPALVRAAPLGY